jgi:16S rRNA (guanine527-N7)-methyltransferase
MSHVSQKLGGAVKQDEAAAAMHAIQELGGELGGIERVDYPSLSGERSLTVVWVAKTSSTPEKYPRKSGKPQKHPL